MRYCLNIPSSVASIGNYTFSGCTNLTNISVDSDNPNYSSENSILFNKDKTALVAYPSAKGDYNIPNTITSIEEGAFAFCRELTNVFISSNVTSIGNYSFYACTELTNITIPKSLIYIGKNAFSHCKELASVTFEDTEDWYKDSSLSGEKIDVSNPEKNASNLKQSQTNWGSHNLLKGKRD